jgi:hypothetical protein
VPAGELSDDTWRLNVDLNDPFEIGLSFNVEAFDIGADYVSMMAARRESDVLLTEGSDGAYAFPGPDNARFGVFGGNETSIGFGGWQGNAQLVATINVDNEFTDFAADGRVRDRRRASPRPDLDEGALELQAGSRSSTPTRTGRPGATRRAIRTRSTRTWSLTPASSAASATPTPRSDAKPRST